MFGYYNILFILSFLCKSKLPIYGLIHKYFKGDLCLKDIYPYLDTNLSIDNIEIFIKNFESYKSRFPGIIKLRNNLSTIYHILTDNLNFHNFSSEIESIVTSAINDDVCKIFNIDKNIVLDIVNYIFSNAKNFNFKKFLERFNFDSDFSRTSKLILFLIDDNYTIIQMNKDLNIKSFKQIKYFLKMFTKNTPIDISFSFSLTRYIIELFACVFSEYPKKIKGLSAIAKQILNFRAVSIDERKKLLLSQLEFYLELIAIYNYFADNKYDFLLHIIESFHNFTSGNFRIYDMLENNGFSKEIVKMFIKKINKLILASGKELIEELLVNFFKYYTADEFNKIKFLKRNICKINNPEFYASDFYENFINVFNLSTALECQILDELVQKNNNSSNWFIFLNNILYNIIETLINIYNSEIPLKYYCKFLLIDDNVYEQLPDIKAKYILHSTFQNLKMNSELSEVVDLVLDFISSSIHLLIDKDKHKTQWYSKMIKLNQTILKLKSSTGIVSDILNDIKPGLSLILPIIQNIFFGINNNKTLKEIISTIDKNFYMEKLIKSYNTGISFKYIYIN